MAAVEACSASALEVVVARYTGDWSKLGDAETDAELIFALLARARQLGWQPVTEVLRLVVAANPGIIHDRMRWEEDGMLPIHLALTLGPAVPLEVVQMLAPERAPSVWQASFNGRTPEQLAQTAGIAGAATYFRHIRDRFEQRQREERQQVEQQRQREAEQQRLLAEQRRQQEAELQRLAAERQRQQSEQAAAERERQEAAAVEEVEQLTEGQILQKAKMAARSGSKGLLMVQQALPRLTLDATQLGEVMWHALMGGSWGVVQEVLGLWDNAKHGDWTLKRASWGVAARDDHVIFPIIEDSRTSDAPAPLADRVALIAELLRLNPKLSTTKGYNDNTPLGTAVSHRVPLDVLEVLAVPEALSMPTGAEEWVPLKLERAEQRRLEVVEGWNGLGPRAFKHIVDLLQRKEQEHTAGKAAERQQRQATLQQAVQAVRAAVQGGDAAALPAALSTVADPQYKDVRTTVLAQVGLPAFFEGLVLQATSMPVVEALDQAYGW